MTTWRPIIAGVDASEASVVAATIAWEIAQAAETDCVLVHGTRDVADIPALVPALTDLDELTAHLTAATRAHLEGALRGRVPPDALARLEVRLDHPTWAIRHAAEEYGAGLVVLGGKHHAAPTRWLGGSTAHHAVRTLDVPILVTTAREGPLRRVLVAVDLSYAATPAIEMARRMASLFRAELRVLHVFENLPAQLAALPIPLDAAKHRRDVEERFADTVQSVLNGAPADRVLRSGVPADVIARESSDWNADVVVVGSHGKGWVDRVIIGSTAERLLNRLPTSTLVVPVRAPKGAATRFVPVAHTAHSP